MKKLKLPIIIFSIVFAISAAALIFFINKDSGKEKIEAPAWIHENGSSGRLPIAATTAESKLKTNDSKKAAPEKPIVSETKPKPIESSQNTTTKISKAVEKVKQDIITEVFLENLSNYIANNYQPAGSMPFKPQKGYSSASFKGINTYFGLNLMGLMVDAQNLVSARKTVWDKLLSPGTLLKAYDNYSVSLLDLVEEKGITAEKEFATSGQGSETRALTVNERSEMFKVSATPLRHVAAVLTAIAENPDLIQAMNGYIKAEKRVERANALFQKSLSESNSSNSVSAKNKTSHDGNILKDAIIVREKIKNGISDKIKTFCAGPCDTPNDVFYITQWVFRRVKGNENRIDSILSGSKLLSKIASMMEARADAIKNNI